MTNLTVTVLKKLYNIHHDQISDMAETLLKNIINGAVIYFFDPVVVVLGLLHMHLVSLPKVRTRCKESKLRRFT